MQYAVAMSTPALDFYVDFSSPYSYIASEWIEALAARHGRAVRWHAVLLGVAPGELLMVAAHPSDLAAAQRAGLKTAYVERPLERGPGAAPENSAGQRFDWVASDFVDLAGKLGA